MSINLSPNHPPKKPLRLIFIASIFIILALLFLVGLLPRLKQNSQNKAIAEDPQLPSVILAEAKPIIKADALILPSSAVAYHVTPLWARTNGYLINYYVDIGDMVKQGQLLADIDTPEVDQQLEQGIADLASAKAKYDIAKISADRWEALYKDNPEAIPVQEVDERKSTLTATEADVLSAEKNVNRLTDIQQFKKIYAPFDGIITKRDVDIGSLINAGNASSPQELFRIAQIDTIRFFVDVPQNYFRQIKDGLAAQVIIKEYPDSNFEGHVVRYAKALDPIARTLRTEVDVDNKEHKILPGLYAEVKFEMKSDIDKFIVPTRAVIIRTDGPLLAVVENDPVVKLIPVVIGRDFGSTLEIIGGLKAGEKYVINPNEKIKDGIQVNIMR